MAKAAVASLSPGRSRFFDLIHETGDKLSLIGSYQHLEEWPLAETIIRIQKQQQKLFKIDAHIQDAVSLALQERSEKYDVNNLTVDESAAIQLYTMESATEQESLFYALNSVLRLADRRELKPFLFFLKLLIGALEKLPSFSGLVYRGVNGNISSNYMKGKKLTWWGFSSCTRSLDVLSKDEFLGKSEQKTLFYIECTSGKSIQSYSYSSPDDDEVLLLPGIEFLVTNKKRAKHGLAIVYLRELPTQTPTPHYVEASDDEMMIPPDVDLREEARQKMCGHACNLWATRRCCNCSGLYEGQSDLSSEIFAIV